MPLSWRKPPRDWVDQAVGRDLASHRHREYDRSSMAKCDMCDNPAVVHEVTVRNGIKSEVHLCQQHAQQAGIAMPGHQPVSQILTQFVISHAPRIYRMHPPSSPKRLPP